MTPSWIGADRARLAAAYRRIHEDGKEPFDGVRYRALYRHFFAADLTEDGLDHQLLGYSCADAVTLLEYLRHLEYHRLRHERRHRRAMKF